MKRSERKVLSKIEPDPPPVSPETAGKQETSPRWWLGLLPVLVLIFGTVTVLAVTGYQSAGGEEFMQQPNPWWKKAAVIAGQGDAYLSIYYGAVFSALIAMILTLLARACPMRDAVDAGLDTMARMLPAIVILVLAWALSTALTDLRLGDVVVEYLNAHKFPAGWLPLAIFIAAAVVSFATGTSWGTMGILCPATVTIGAGLAANLEPSQALTLFYASVGSVLAGAIFGDHCSPISDTTVLSSIASGCRHEEHVWTQMPYALVTAIVAMGLGNVLCSVYEQPWYYGLGAGTIALILIVLIVGRRPSPSFELADAA